MNAPTPRPAPSDDGLTPVSSSRFERAVTGILITLLFLVGAFFLLYSLGSVAVHLCP